jgi:hypothetical protein
VPVTGGSVSAELVLQQLDLVTVAQQRFLPSMCASVHRSPVPLDSLRDRHKIWNPWGEAIVPKQAVHAIRLGISAEQLLAVCSATAASPEPQQAHRQS